MMVLFTALLTIFSIVASAQELQTLDKIVAIVDDDLVLQSELDLRIIQIASQIEGSGQQLPPEEQLRNDILDQLIIESLQKQMAERAGIRINDNQLNSAMGTIAAQNNMTFDQFRQALEQQGLYLQTRDQLRQSIILDQLQTNVVNSRIEITRQEIENYLRSETGAQAIAPEYRVAHILIENGPDRDRRAELADLLYKQITNGTSILDILQQREVSGIPLGGAALEFRKPENLPSVFREIVPELSLMEVTEPFTSASGFHIAQLLDIRGGATLELDQYHVRHILITPNEIRTEAQAEALIHDLYQRIQDGEDLGDLARQHTDDDTTIVAGGDLDWVTSVELPPDFWAAIEATPVGEMSEPLKLQTGWHIIEVLDYRLEDMTEENMRYQAEQMLRSRKYENELQNWLTELRDTAYIDIKLE